MENIYSYFLATGKLDIDIIYDFNRKKIIKTINLFGQEIAPQKFEPFIVIYDDGTVEKKIILE